MTLIKESVSSVVAKIPHFIGLFRPSIQKGQNGQANGQDFLNILYIFSLSLPAELVTTRDETIGFLP